MFIILNVETIEKYEETSYRNSSNNQIIYKESFKPTTSIYILFVYFNLFNTKIE